MLPPICAAVVLPISKVAPLYRTLQQIVIISFLTVVAFTGSALPAQAQATYTVNATDDVDDGGTCDAVDLHCTLREAIRNANADGTASIINFDIDPDQIGNACGLAAVPPGPWCTIILITDLPPLTASDTTINGFTQQDTNTGMITSIRPGVIDATNPCPVLEFEKPDVAINGGAAAINIFTVGPAADHIVIKGLSIYNGKPGFDGHAILGLPAASFGTAPRDRQILENFVGLLPDGSDPVAFRNQDFGVRQFSPGFMTIWDNYIGYNGKGGADATDAVGSLSVVDIRRNEVFENGWRSMAHDGIDVNGILSVCECNYTHDNTNALNAPRGDSGTGIEIGSKQATSGLDQNIIRYNTVERNTSAGVSIRKGPRGNLFEKNVVFRNWVGFSIDTEGRIPTNRNELSQNSTFQNMSALSGGIDLNATKFTTDPLGNVLPIDPGAWSGNPDGLTPNDPCDADGGPAPDGDPANTQTNDLQNFPDLMSATAIGSDLRVEGELMTFPNRWYRIEFFRTPAGDNVGRGEGKVFIGAIRRFVDADCTVTFSHVFPGAGVPAGDEITATATRDENAAEPEVDVNNVQQFDDVWSTSEYSEPEVVDLFLPEGKVTGGGQIDPPDPLCTAPCDDSGATTTRSSFGFNASYHNGNFDPFGHTNFVYKPGKIHLSSVDYAFASLKVNRDPLTATGDAQWRGSAKVNNKKGFCFEVFVRDNNEPGTADTFRIRIWSDPLAADWGDACNNNGDAAFFDSGETVLSNGNIQIHKPQ